MADDAEKRGYGMFAEYCRSREKGRREEAFAHLESFVAEMEKKPFATRRAFAGWLFGFCFYNPHLLEACPVLLRAKIVAPAIDEWIRTEPENPQALRWSQDERAVLVAVRLAPHDQIAVGRFASMTLARIEYSMHGSAGAQPGHPHKEELAELEAVIALLEANPVAVLEELKEEASELKNTLRQRLRSGSS
ncbi:MAG: hypothetical protein ACXWBP_13600 [Limisphaerales bacterium]